MSQRFEFARRLGGDWRDMAAVLNIPAHRQRSFEAGREAYGIWEYLADRNRLAEIRTALLAVGRQDLVHLVGTDRVPVPGAGVADPGTLSTSTPLPRRAHGGISGEVQATRIDGHATGVELDRIPDIPVTGVVAAQTIGPGGTVVGVHIADQGHISVRSQR